MEKLTKFFVSFGIGSALGGVTIALYEQEMWPLIIPLFVLAGYVGIIGVATIIKEASKE
jgi:predicted membrane channel-forming protein YqfA (hemolysin III family)